MTINQPQPTEHNEQDASDSKLDASLTTTGKTTGESQNAGEDMGSSTHIKSSKLLSKDNIITVAIALLIAVVIRLWIAEPRYIPSDSMLPTLEVGDRLVIEKVSHWFQSPHVGDIVVFTPPQLLKDMGYSDRDVLIKRVIGTPGHEFSIHDGAVYLDQQRLSEPYIAESPGYSLQSVIVPAHYFLVLGDNRNNSNDSHVWGFLPEENILGRAIFRFWPFERIGRLTSQ